ncbi:heat-inducible transcriptional repressor HrcA [Gemmatimonadota bacterium]
MPFRTLTERENTILSLIVQSYILDCSPVGSRTLVRRFGLDLSPATIRNTMNDLEEAGLLIQPHTSAGRIPTSLGYRVYVDELMDPKPLSRKDRATIRDAVMGEHSGHIRDAATVLDQTVRALGGLTRLLAVSLEPRLDLGTFEKIELVSLGAGKILAVLTIEKGFLRTIVLELEAAVKSESLTETAGILNERLSGLPMKIIRESVRERMRDVSATDPKVLKLIVNNSEDIFSSSLEEGGIHVWGTPNILSQPEFADQERMVALIGALEEKEIIVRILGGQHREAGLTITIGEENTDGEIKFCSVVASPYAVGEVSGSLGIVGPTRMEYSKLVSIVDYTARIVSEVLGEAPSRVELPDGVVPMEGLK